MKIAPLKIHPYYNKQTQRKTQIHNNYYMQDTFIKNQNINFTNKENKNRDEIMSSFMSELMDCNKKSNEKLTISQLQNIIDKYVDNVQVLPFNKAPKELLYSNRLLGLYCVPIEFDEETKQAHLSNENRFFYTNCASAKSNVSKLDICLNTAHEFTHILQDEDTSCNGLNIINAFLEKNSKDIEDSTQQVGLVLYIRNTIEEEIRKPIVEFLLTKEGERFKEEFYEQPKILKALCNKVGIRDFKNYVKNIVNEIIEVMEDEKNIKLDKNLLYDLTLNLFEKEKEAYSNQNLMLKKLTSKEYRDIQTDARIQIYNESIKAIEELKAGLDE